MSLEKVPKRRWRQARNENEQSTQVSMATLRAATRHRHTDRISGDTSQPTYLPRPIEGREGQGAKARHEHIHRSMQNTLPHTSGKHHISAPAKPRM